MNISGDITCYLCGSNELEICFPGRDGETVDMSRAFLITDGEYTSHPDIFRCRTCSLTFSDPNSETAEPLEHYRDMVDPEYHHESRGRSVSFTRILRELERIGPHGSIVDIGAATGIFLSIAKERGWTVTGVEPSSWAIREARERYGITINNGILQDAAFAENSFDAAVLLDVIEHVTDPRALLTEILRIVKPGGSIVLTTPDIASPVARLLAHRWWHIRRAHQFYFTRKTLDLLLNEFPVRIVRRRHYPWSFSLHYWISRFENFSPPLYRVLAAIERTRIGLRLSRIIVRMNFFDSFEWYLQKK